jgi:hypothetical protein
MDNGTGALFKTDPTAIKVQTFSTAQPKSFEIRKAERDNLEERNINSGERRQCQRVQA